MAISVVQTMTGVYGNLLSTNIASFSSPSVAGNLIVVFIEVSSTTGLTVTDNQGNTYSSDNIYTAGNIALYSAIATNNNTITITVGISSMGLISFTATEVSGIVGTLPLDQTATGTGNPATATTATTIVANEYVACVIYNNNSSSSAIATPTGFTNRYYNPSSPGILACDKIITSTGAQTATEPSSGDGNTYWVALATYKSSSSGVVIFQIPAILLAL